MIEALPTLPPSCWRAAWLGCAKPNKQENSVRDQTGGQEEAGSLDCGDSRAQACSPLPLASRMHTIPTLQGRGHAWQAPFIKDLTTSQPEPSKDTKPNAKTHQLTAPGSTLLATVVSPSASEAIIPVDWLSHRPPVTGECVIVLTWVQKLHTANICRVGN